MKVKHPTWNLIAPAAKWALLANSALTKFLTKLNNCKIFVQFKVYITFYLVVAAHWLHLCPATPLHICITACTLWIQDLYFKIEDILLPDNITCMRHRPVALLYLAWCPKFMERRFWGEEIIQGNVPQLDILIFLHKCYHMWTVADGRRHKSHVDGGVWMMLGHALQTAEL